MSSTNKNLTDLCCEFGKKNKNRRQVMFIYFLSVTDKNEVGGRSMS